MNLIGFKPYYSVIILQIIIEVAGFCIHFSNLSNRKIASFMYCGKTVMNSLPEQFLQ